MTYYCIPRDLPPEEWARMPKPKQRLCGLSRTTLLELSEAGHIRTVAIRKPGSIKGIRLVHMPTLIRFLDGLAETQTKPMQLDATQTASAPIEDPINEPPTEMFEYE